MNLDDLEGLDEATLKEIEELEKVTREKDGGEAFSEEKVYIDKIYIAPAATQYQPYLAKLLCDTNVKIELSNNPYRQT